MILVGCNFTPFSPRELSIVKRQTYLNKKPMIISAVCCDTLSHVLHSNILQQTTNAQFSELLEYCLFTTCISADGKQSTYSNKQINWTFLSVWNTVFPLICISVSRNVSMLPRIIYIIYIIELLIIELYKKISHLVWGRGWFGSLKLMLHIMSANSYHRF